MLRCFLAGAREKIRRLEVVIVAHTASVGPRPRVFISYAREDRDIAARVFDSYRSRSSNLGSTRESLQGGEKWDQRIRNELEATDYALVLYTPALCRKTDSYVNREIALARDRALSVRGSFLVPLRTADIAAEDRIAELGEYQRDGASPRAVRLRFFESHLDDAPRLPASQPVVRDVRPPGPVSRRSAVCRRRSFAKGLLRSGTSREGAHGPNPGQPDGGRLRQVRPGQDLSVERRHCSAAAGRGPSPPDRAGERHRARAVRFSSGGNTGRRRTTKRRVCTWQTGSRSGVFSRRSSSGGGTCS